MGNDTWLDVANHRRGNLMYAAGQLDSAKTYYLSAYQTYLKACDTSEALMVYCRAGIMQCLAGDYAGAEKIYRSAIRRASGRTNVLAFAYNQMGTLYHYQGIADSARHYYGASTALFAELQDTAGMLRPMYNHAVLLMESDKNTLQTMLRNLLDNAIKFSPPGSTVTLSTVESEAGVTVSMTNPGAGIPEEKLRDIFLLQKDKSEPGTAGEKGIGLGLHLVQELVQLNRGMIEILSRPNVGTEVRLTLPARA